jgi:hypothetical protein
MRFSLLLWLFLPTLALLDINPGIASITWHPHPLQPGANSARQP